MAANTNPRETGVGHFPGWEPEEGTSHLPPAKGTEHWVSLSSFCSCSSCLFGPLSTDPKCQKQWKRGAPELGSTLKFHSRRAAALLLDPGRPCSQDQGAPRWLGVFPGPSQEMGVLSTPGDSSLGWERAGVGTGQGLSS